MPLPRFLGIGALKSGTTTLDRLLRAHPGLFLPADRKEVHYFDRHHQRGAGWYAAAFAGAGDRLPGEVTPEYLHDERVPERVRTLIPHARLVVVLRDPVERAFSQYRSWVRDAAWGGSFGAFLEEHPDAFARGLYHAQLARWLALFPREQLHVLLFEDLVADPVGEARGVYRFLGVDASFSPPLANRAENVTRRPRFPRAFRAARRVADRLYDADHPAAVARVKRLGLHRLLLGAPMEGRPDPRDAAELSARYAPDVRALGDLLGRDLSAAWPSVSPGTSRCS